MKKKTVLTIIAVFLLWNGSNLFAQMIDYTKTRVERSIQSDWKWIGSIRQRSIHDIPGEQSWTLGCETLCRDYIYWDTYKEYVAPLGIKRIRFQGGWAKTEKEKGVYDFAWLDYIIDDARKRGLSIWLETDYGNPIYEGGGGKDLAGGFPTSKEALEAWDRWVGEMARRYKDKVWAWAMWNEPDIGKPKRSPQMISEFNIRTAEVIKKIIPDARIGALSLAHNDAEYLDQCLQYFADHHKLELFEWIIYHGYAKNPDTSYSIVEKMAAVVDKYNKKYKVDLKLWQGENGCPSERASKFALSGHDWSELTQAKWDARRMLGDLGHDVISSVFTICDFDHTGREINHKGLLKINDKRHLAKVKMAWYTVQNVVSVFDPTLARLKEYSCSIQCDKEITWYAYRDQKANQDVLVCWDGTGIPSDSNEALKAAITIENGKFKDPVWADIVSGYIREIPKKNIKFSGNKMILIDVPVYDGPIIITDRTRLIPE
ncbi:MAG: beta-galactosidase [Planctomycetia bacterium]|nr:beta-galactosidase [Planctomycetia bacterium]